MIILTKSPSFLIDDASLFKYIFTAVQFANSAYELIFYFKTNSLLEYAVRRYSN